MVIIAIIAIARGDGADISKIGIADFGYFPTLSIAIELFHTQAKCYLVPSPRCSAPAYMHLCVTIGKPNVFWLS